MKHRAWVWLILVMFMFALSACGLLREPEEASGTIEAIPLAVDEEATVPSASATPAATATAIPETPETGMESTPASEPEAPTAVPTEAPAATAVAAAGELRIYQISQADSQVRFELDEDLRGQRITVVGTTDQVAGELAVNLADLAATQVGVIQINARTLQTDNNFRNRAIQNEILDTGAFEFITFTPTDVVGLPAGASVGEEVSFSINGDLTIRDITQPVTFNVTATSVSPTQIAGIATTTIAREAFGLTIPEVPNVANVEEEVELYINFVANAT